MCDCKVVPGYYDYPNGGIEARYVPEHIAPCSLHANAERKAALLDEAIEALRAVLDASWPELDEEELKGRKEAWAVLAKYDALSQSQAGGKHAE